MKKYLKGLISLVIAIIVVMSVFTFGVSAAGVVSTNKSELSPGDTVTATITFNAGEPMLAVQAKINYDSSKLEYTNGKASGGAGLLTLVEETIQGDVAPKTASFTLTFKAIATGNANISVSDSFYSTQGDNGAEDKAISFTGKSVSIINKTLSANNNLKSIKPYSGTLEPAFSPDITEYTVNVPNSVKECKISATKQDSSSKFSIQGSATLKVGKNVRTIVVTAANGEVKKYIITINRSETADIPQNETDVTPENSPLSVSVNGVSNTITADITNVELLEGFTVETENFKGVEVQVAKDENYTIYYLMANETGIVTPYIYDEKSDKFTQLEVLTKNDSKYIIADIPTGKNVPKEYYKSSTTIDGTTALCYVSTNTNFADFYYIYAYKAGEYGFYRYDSKDGSLQRYPELVLYDINAEPEKDDKDDSFMTKYDSLTSNGKVIIVSLLSIIVLSIILIVIFLVKFLRERKLYENEDEGNEQFDNFEYNEPSLFMDDDLLDEEIEIPQADDNFEADEVSEEVEDEEIK